VAASAHTSRLEQAPEVTLERSSDRRRLLMTVGDYVALTKPRVMSLLLLTTIAAMIAAVGELPDAGRLLATIAGGMMAAGGASAINHVLDRDLDRLMGARTENRPVAAGRITPARALWFGATLTLAAFVLLLTAAGALAAVLALAGGFVYVLIYTCWLKRTTPQNIVIGGIAGAIPPLVGWAAATGSLAAPAWLMYAIVVLWTPPHFWALALILERQYADAGVPMLPVVKGAHATASQILAYSCPLVAVSLLPAAWQAFGLPYLAAALILGGVQLGLARALLRRPSMPAASRLFHFSLIYLALLFAALAAASVMS
jgi:protoheme IX farnesyltransferase